MAHRIETSPLDPYQLHYQTPGLTPKALWILPGAPDQSWKQLLDPQQLRSCGFSGKLRAATGDYGLLLCPQRLLTLNRQGLEQFWSEASRVLHPGGKLGVLLQPEVDLPAWEVWLRRQLMGNRLQPLEPLLPVSHQPLLLRAWRV